MDGFLQRDVLPEEDYMSSDAEKHSDDTVAHQAEVPSFPPLPLLCRRLLRARLVKLLPVTQVLRTDGKVVERGS